MTAEVTVITGPAQSGKTGRMLAGYVKSLRQNQPYSTLWLAPTWRAAVAVRELLLQEGLKACFSSGVMTFDGLTQQAVRSAPMVIRPLDPLRRRRLVRQLVQERLADGRLHYYRPLAELGGLVELVAGSISSMKRREVWPSRFRQLCETRGMGDRDAELLDLYEAYQSLLSENQLYDPEGCFWIAKQMIREGRWAPLERLRTVVADGFTDFTVGQHEILEHLASRCESLSVTLPLEEETRRPDLFASSTETLHEFNERYPHLTHEYLASPKKPAWPAMAHLERALFGNPRESQPAADTAGLEILAASRQLGEIELVGTRIRRLLAAGCPRSGDQPVRPSEVAVVFRSVAEVAPLVREVFGKLGIPVAIEATETLERVPALAALVAVLRLDVEDWPFRRLLGVLTNNYLRPNGPEWTDQSAVAVERAVRRLQVPRGRTLLLEQLRRQLVPDAREAHEEQASQSQHSQTQTALQTLTQLAQALDAMPPRATLHEWAVAWQHLAQQVGLFDVLQQQPGQWEAWRLLFDALRADDIVFGWMREPPPMLDRTEALASLIDVLRNVTLPREAEETGRVRVLSAPSVRGLQVPYLFVAGLAEKSFPQPVRQIVLDEPSEDGDPKADPQARHYREEMLLFYQVVTRATRQLVLSYPAFDESAQPLTPSPYLDEVEQACGPGAIVRTEVPDLTPVPRDDEPLTTAGFRVKALANALEGDTRLLAALVREESSPGLAENLLAGIRLTRQRQNAKEFGPCEGMLLGPAALEYCAGAFGPRRTFSATELEQYARCPFRYFVERVLHVRPLEDLALEVDYLARGRLVHEALATFHQRVNQWRGCPTSPATLSPEDYNRLVDETLDSLFSRHADGTVQAAMEEIDRRLWRQWINAYREQHAKYDELWRDCDTPLVPMAFEVSFGQRCEAGPLGTERALEIRFGDRTVRISGRIDRIDVGKVAGQTVFNVIDCKSGTAARVSHDAIASGTLLQLPLYAMAVEELLLADEKAVPWQAGYWEIQGGGFKAKNTLQMHTCTGGSVQPVGDWGQTRATAAETIVALVAAMRGGQFPVFNADEHCTRRCPLRTICRINQIRSLEKQWQATGEQV